MFTRDDWDPGDMMNGSTGDGVTMWVVLGLFLVVALGVAALVLLQASARSRQADASLTTVAEASSPRQLLDRRLARGDIDAEEYTTARTLLDH